MKEPAVKGSVRTIFGGRMHLRSRRFDDSVEKKHGRGRVWTAKDSGMSVSLVLSRYTGAAAAKLHCTCKSSRKYSH